MGTLVIIGVLIALVFLRWLLSIFGRGSMFD